MGNCLVTKLKESVSGAELLKIGELRIEVINGDASYSAYLSTKTGTQQTISIINGTGTFEGGGTTMVIGHGDYMVKATAGSIISIPDKYNLEGLQMNGATLYSRDLSSLYYSGLTSINCSNGDNLGDGNRINGTTDDLAKLTSLNYINLRGHNITGDVSALQSLDLDTAIFESNVYGDLAKLPASIKEYSNYSSDGRYTWDSTRSASSNIPVIRSLSAKDSEETDKIIIGMSQCTAIASPGLFVVNPVRTSASDSAVAILQAKGYSIS